MPCQLHTPLRGGQMTSRNAYKLKMLDEDIDVDFSLCARGHRPVSAAEQIQTWAG